MLINVAPTRIAAVAFWKVLGSAIRQDLRVIPGFNISVVRSGSAINEIRGCAPSRQRAARRREIEKKGGTVVTGAESHWHRIRFGIIGTVVHREVHRLAKVD